MMKMKILSIISCSLIVASAFALNPVKANAEWRRDHNGSWYAEGSSWAIGWKLIDGAWYYFGSNGYLERNKYIDGYYVDDKGKWVDIKSSIGTDTKFISVIYRLDNLKVTRMSSGKHGVESYDGEDKSKKAEVAATYGALIIDAKDYNDTDMGLMIKISKGTCKLVKVNGTVQLEENGKVPVNNATTQVTIFYRLDNLKETRLCSGKHELEDYYGEIPDKKVDVKATYGALVVDAKDYNDTDTGLMKKVSKEIYILVKENGTVKLVKNDNPPANKYIKPVTIFYSLDDLKVIRSSSGNHSGENLNGNGPNAEISISTGTLVVDADDYDQTNIGLMQGISKGVYKLVKENGTVKLEKVN